MAKKVKEGIVDITGRDPVLVLVEGMLKFGIERVELDRRLVRLLDLMHKDLLVVHEYNKLVLEGMRESTHLGGLSDVEMFEYMQWVKSRRVLSEKEAAFLEVLNFKVNVQRGGK